MAKRKNLFRMKIETDNAAFDYGNGPGEVSRLLKEVQGLVLDGGTGGDLHDINGNFVGTWSLTFPKEK